MSSPKTPHQGIVPEKFNVPVRKLTTLPVDVAGGPLQYCDSAQTTLSPTLQTDLYSKCDGSKKAIVGTPSVHRNSIHPSLLSDFMEACVSGNLATIQVANRSAPVILTPKNKAVVTEIIAAMARGYADGTLATTESNPLVALKQQVYAAASDGQFTPAEENAIIASAQKIASGARQK